MNSPFGNREPIAVHRWLLKLAFRVPPGETLRLTQGYMHAGPLSAVAIKGLDRPTPVDELIGPAQAASVCRPRTTRPGSAPVGLPFWYVTVPDTIVAS
jgi:hypothetical protein